jgi:hypothetical protein
MSVPRLSPEERYRQFYWGVLAQACDEAPLGIWEPYWWANNVLRDLRVDDRLAWSERVLIELLEAAHIRFFHQTGADPRSGTTSLGTAEALAIIRSDIWRQVPLEKAEVWFEATEGGDQRVVEAVANREWLGEEAARPDWNST